MCNPQKIVSIACLVYNHEPYLRECFDGFVMQQTNFPIEILVHDDASTDHSADIIREYTEKYPDLFKPIYQTENHYSKGVDVFALNVKRAKGKYIAVCEGDDYWIDPLKLQKQVVFMEEHEDVNIVTTNCYELIKGQIREKHKNIASDCYYSSEDYTMSFFETTCTFLIRKEALVDYNEFLINNKLNIAFGDYPMVYYLSHSKRLYRMSDYTAVYRWGNGVFAGNSQANNILQTIMTLDAMSKMYNDESCIVQIRRHQNRLLRDFLLNRMMGGNINERLVGAMNTEFVNVKYLSDFFATFGDTFFYSIIESKAIDKYISAYDMFRILCHKIFKALLNRPKSQASRRKKIN